MSYYKRSGQMDLTDRVAIETGLCRGESFKRIAKRIGRHPTTVAHEVMENRTYIKGTYFAGKDCRHVRTCVMGQKMSAITGASIAEVMIAPRCVKGMNLLLVASQISHRMSVIHARTENSASKTSTCIRHHMLTQL